MSGYSQENRLLNIKTSVEGVELFLERISGAEAVSTPFEFKLTMLSPDDSVDLKGLLRKTATISIVLVDGTERPFHGVFRSLRQTREGEEVMNQREQAGVSNPSIDLTVYEGILVPQVWFLSLDADCRIFQDKTVPEIVEEILTEAGIRDYQFNAALKDQSKYPKRDYCVQYRESSLNFISRLLEEEGIFYFFQHTATQHLMVFADSSSTMAPCPGQGTATYSASQSGWSDDNQDGVINLDRLEQAHTGKSVLSDYSFEKPNVNLGTNLSVDNEEVFDYPGKYSEISQGDRYARVRLEEREVDQFVVTGLSRVRAFRPGYTFKLKGHPRADTNQDYFLVFVKHDAFDSTYRQDKDAAHSYTNDFTCIPKSIPYRPARKSRKPFVQGPQSALVVGPSGEEIWVDKYGRVKVQFYWDRLGKKNESSSCWVRVSQIWAGKNWGWMTIPRMGQEVIVDFLEGDPDRPIITGRVYNAEQMPPYTLPDNQTQSGIKSRSSKTGSAENFNEIRFEDLKGSEMVTVHAEKDMETTVENDDTQKVQRNRLINVDGTHTETIVKDTAITISEGNHSLTINKGNQTIKLDMGNQSTTLSMGNQSITLAMGNQTTKLDLGAATTEAMQSIELKVGASSVKVDQMGVTIQGMMIKINGEVMTTVQAGAMLTLKGAITMIN